MKRFALVILIAAVLVALLAASWGTGVPTNWT